MATSAYERRIQNYLAAHPGAIRQEARGHGATPEQGAETFRGAPQLGDTTELRRTGDVKLELQRIAKRDPGARVEITTYDRNGNPHAILRETRAGRERGAQARGLAKKLRQHRTFQDGVMDAMGATAYKNDRRFQNIVRVQIRVIPNR